MLQASYHFHRFPLWLFVPFPLVSCISCIFNIFFQCFTRLLQFPIVFAPFSLVVIAFSCTSLYSSSMFTASSWFALSIRSGFLHFPRDFPWFVPSIRSVFVRFPGDFVRFPLIVVMFSGPPSANYLVVHNPAKCSVFSRSTQGHGEISFPFGNHPPHPLFSLRSQTATSQLAGFRNNVDLDSGLMIDHWCLMPLSPHDAWLTNVLGHHGTHHRVRVKCEVCFSGTQWDNGLNGLITAKVTNMSELESLVCSIQKFPSMFKILCPCHDVWSMEYLPATQCSS